MISGSQYELCEKIQVKFISKGKTSNLMFRLYTIFIEKKNYEANISDSYPDPVLSASFRRIQIRIISTKRKA
jgi:hypothetical protein